MTRKTEAKGTEGSGRRDFLKLASLSGPAAVAAAVSLRTAEAEADESDTGSTGMKDTAHTRAYYDSARF